MSRSAKGLPLSDTQEGKGNSWVGRFCFSLNLSTLFTGDILSLLVASQPKKDRLTVLVVAGPLSELNLGDQHTHCPVLFSGKLTSALDLTPHSEASQQARPDGSVSSNGFDHRRDFDAHTVDFQKGPLFGDLHCFIQVIRLKQDISAQSYAPRNPGARLREIS